MKDFRKNVNRSIVIFLILLFLLTIISCGPSQSPDISLLGPPIVRLENAEGGSPHALDYWELDDEGYPISAGFGYTVTYQYDTGEVYDGPGVLTTLNVSGHRSLGGHPLGHVVYSPDADDSDDPNSICGSSSEDGSTLFSAEGLGWGKDYIFDSFVYAFYCYKEESKEYAMGEAVFAQEASAPFVFRDKDRAGAWWKSGQGPVNIVTPKPKSKSRLSPRFKSYSGFKEVAPRPKINTLEISEKEYSSVLPGVKWMRAKFLAGDCLIEEIDKFVLLPCPENAERVVANRVWPYFISICVKENFIIGTSPVTAILSIVDPNNIDVSHAQISVNYVGEYEDSDCEIWRTDYFVVIEGTEPDIKSFDNNGTITFTIRLPEDFRIRVFPKVDIAAISRLQGYWLSSEEFFDANQDGIVNLVDYSKFLTDPNCVF